MALLTDPIDLKLDADGDLVIEGGDLVFVTGVEAVAQDIRRNILLVRGEVFTDVTLGVPWLERPGVTAAAALLGQKFDQVKTRTAIRAAILRADNVHEILSLDVTYDNAARRVQIDWEVQTAFGITQGSETI